MIRFKLPARSYQDVLDPSRQRRVLFYRAAIAFAVMLILLGSLVFFDRSDSTTTAMSDFGGNPVPMLGESVTGTLPAGNIVAPRLAPPDSDAAASLLPAMPGASSAGESMPDRSPDAEAAGSDAEGDTASAGDVGSLASVPDDSVATVVAGDSHGSVEPPTSADVTGLPSQAVSATEPAAPAPAAAPGAPEAAPSRRAQGDTSASTGAARTRPTTSDVSRAAAPAAPTSTAPGATDAGAGRYQVVVGSFIEQPAAIALQGELASTGHPAVTQSRVTVGPFSTRSEAESVSNRLRAEHALRGILVSAPSGQGHSVQVGVFSEAGNAIRLINRLEAAGFSARHDRRVLLGPYTERQIAERAATTLRQGRSLEASVVRLR